MLEKNEEIEQPIPVEWRPVIIEIVEVIRSRSLESKEIFGFEVVVDSKDVEYIYNNIDSYGDSLTRLENETWDASICRWMGGYWNLLIDLFTEEEGLSDLVLFIDVYEKKDSACFKIKSVHVP